MTPMDLLMIVVLTHVIAGVLRNNTNIMSKLYESLGLRA
jgi:hypothetical protein